ncbi:MAG TPA: TetR/AcrR family transcriptional regulator [bacterium]|nr:TetR/AcrR family transcriptional regulator [bacterium]
MSKGQATRQSILEHATSLASRIGLEALSIGKLAEALNLSKSGLFAHFRSKEALQIQVMEHAAERFVETVIKPALKAPRGIPRIQAIFERWRKWPEANSMDGGCLFVAAATELDDRPGPARDYLVQQQKDWQETLATIARTAISEGHFSDDVDPEQFAFELYGIMLAYHFSSRLGIDPAADQKAERAFKALLAKSQIH